MVNIDPALMEFIEAASEGVDTVLDCATRLLGPSDSDSHLHAVALHATITELLSGCIVLALNEHPTGIPILLRSMYEALVDLDNLLHVSGYIEHIEAANLTQLVKLLDAATTNPLLRGLNELHGARLDEFQGRIRQLKAAGKRPLSIESRCETANRLPEYQSLYRIFSLDVHSNSAALGDRHVSESPEGTPQVSFFGVMDPRITSGRLDHGLRFLIDSARMIHEAFRTDSREISELAERFRQERPGRLKRVGITLTG